MPNEHNQHAGDVTRQRIPETIVPGKRLGRHIHIDARSIAENPAQTAEAKHLRSVRHVSAGLPLNQGDIGSCTANALCGALNSVPHWKAGQPTLDETQAVSLYSAETVLEGDPYPPNDPGGSGLAVCQAAKTLGWLRGYEHAITLQDALLALVLRPVITGVSWFSSFDTPDANGVVTITADAYVRGGHEVVADELIVPAGVTVEQPDEILVGLWNSWGPGYGVGGRFYWSAATWGRLLAEGGDVMVPRTARGWVAPSARTRSLTPFQRLVQLVKEHL